MRARTRWASVIVVASSCWLVAALPATGGGRAGTAWSIVPSANETGSNWLQAVSASAANDAWAVGWYLPSTGQDETLALHWNGTAWSVVDTPNGGQNGDQLFGVAAVSPSDAWSVGWAAGSPTTYTSTTVVEHWTGSSWSVVSSPNPSKDPLYGTNQLYDVRAFASDDVWAAGWQWVPAGSAPLVEHWDGRSWKVSKTPSSGFLQTVALDGTSSNDIWAVGYGYTFSSGGDQSLVMHYDGSRWSVVPTPVLSIDNYLNDVAAISPTDVWAVGYSRTSSLDIQPYFLHWDGSTWSTVPTSHLSSRYNFLKSIVAVSADDVWAGGYRTVNGNEVSFVEHWNGTAWRVDPTPNQPAGGNYLYGLGRDPGGGLWSAGYFYPDDFSPFTTLVMHRSSS